MKKPSFLESHQQSILSGFSVLSVWQIRNDFLAVLIYMTPTINEVEHLFMYLGPFICLFLCLAWLWILPVFPLEFWTFSFLNFYNFFYILGLLVFYLSYVLQISSPSLFFILFMVIFAMTFVLFFSVVKPIFSYSYIFRHS